MKTEVLDANLTRHECITCDKCGAQWTVAVCVKQGWLITDEKDLCNRCRPKERK